MSQNVLYNYISDLSEQYSQHPEVQQMANGLEGILGPHFDSTIVDVCIERQAWKELCEELYDTLLTVSYEPEDWKKLVKELVDKIEQTPIADSNN
jgi:hypothetical protein